MPNPAAPVASVNIYASATQIKITPYSGIQGGEIVRILRVWGCRFLKTSVQGAAVLCAAALHTEQSYIPGQLYIVVVWPKMSIYCAFSCNRLNFLIIHGDRHLIPHGIY